MHSKTEKEAVLGVASEEGGKEKAEQNLQKKELKKRRYETDRNRKGRKVVVVTGLNIENCGGGGDDAIESAQLEIIFSFWFGNEPSQRVTGD